LATVNLKDSPYFANYWSDFGEIGIPNSGLPPYIEGSAATGFIPLPPDIDVLKANALARLVPHIKQQLSIINTLVELGDIKTIAPTVLRTLKHVRNLARSSVTPRRTRKLIRRPESTLRVAAEGYLQKEFNLGPLQSDMEGIYASLCNWWYKVYTRYQNSSRPTTLYFRFRRQDEPVQSQDSNSGWYWLTSGDEFFVNEDPFSQLAITDTGLRSFECERVVRADSTIFCAQIQCNIMYTEFQRENARWLALLDELGFNWNPRAAWNAIPWSFVVDWLVRVGKQLDRYKVGFMDATVNILQSSWSIKRVRTIDVQYRVGMETMYDGRRWTTVLNRPTFTESAYRRCVEPLSRSSLELSGLSPKEFSLGAALLAVRKPHFKRLRT